MFKRFLSLVLVAIVMLSMAVVAVSAAQVEIADNGAGAVAEVGAESSAETGSSNTFTFDVKSAGWENFKKLYCYIWEYGGEPLNDITWQSKKGLMKDNGDGTWSFDLDKAGISFDDSKAYAVIFSNENGAQSYDLICGKACIGDTAYCTGDTLENPKDSNKTSQVAVWKGQDKSVYGPMKAITSIGNIVGDCIPSTSSASSFLRICKRYIGKRKNLC